MTHTQSSSVCATARQIVEECSRQVHLHATAMREENMTLGYQGVAAIADGLLSRFDFDGFGMNGVAQPSNGTIEEIIAKECYVAGIGDGYQVSGIEQAATAIRALAQAPGPNPLRVAMAQAIDLLTERTYGNPARSAGHNARLVLEAALAAPQSASNAYTSQALSDVGTERYGQITREGWTSIHDDQHDTGEMARAAASYALSAGPEKVSDLSLIHKLWPWEWRWFKPRSKREDLVRAGALIVAEIERLDRRTPPMPSTNSGDAE